MSPLHTPQELVEISNAAHVAEGVILIILALLLLVQGIGYLRKAWQQYLAPGVALLASITLIGFLLFDHLNELPEAWYWITTDMQQQQHLLIGTILGITSALGLVGVKYKIKLLNFALPTAFVAIGIVFLVHPQHGNGTEAARALLIHRIAGSSLIVAGIACATSLSSRKLRKTLSVISSIALFLSAGLFICYREPLIQEDMPGMNMVTSENHHTYQLNIISDPVYQPMRPTNLKFDIRNEKNEILRNFDIVHTKPMHFIVIRKDRTNFQHVHPDFDTKSGTFTVNDLLFSMDGEYRIFADFTLSDTQKDNMDMKLAVTPYKDVVVGDLGKYTPTVLNSDKLSNTSGGLSMEITPPPSDEGTGTLTYWAKNNGIISIDIKKDGKAYKNLESYLGALGHMVAFGPNLEFIHTHPLTENVEGQQGFLLFNIYFPDPGQYKLYLQMQVDGQVTTTDYSLSVKAPL